jgi:hypothetical protein
MSGCNMRIKMCAAVVVVMGTTVGVGLSSSVAAETVEDFYRGKRITLIDGYEAGSPFDVYARLLARHMSAHIPGTPNIIVQNMQGAGSLTATNHLFNIAARDGSVFGNFHGNMGLEPKVEAKGTRYDGRKFTWIGSMAKQTLVCATWAKSGLRTIDDLREREVLAGSSGGTAGSASVFPRVMNSLVGTKFRLITGYTDNDLPMALERGEVESRCGVGWASIKATRPDWIAEKKIFTPVILSLKTHPELPGVPTLMDYVTGADNRGALEVMFTPQEAGRPFAAPPAIPADRATALRRGFDAALNDKALLAEADRAQIEIDPITGEDIEAMLVRLYDLPDDVFRRVAGYRQPGSGEKTKD